ncbi:MAG: heme biosynthesis HemY N-terminal domain-containing protein [Brachymonas sp.]|nr:heme biosynthesis HemY N-terminal domain-containing protein [Brachymonas sp.]
MRALLWLLLLFFLAVGLALLTGGNQPVLTLYWPPDKAIDISLNFAIIVFIALFVLLQVLLRATEALRRLPRQAQRWRMRQRERAMHAQLLDALSYYLAGRFARARKAAQQALHHDEALHAARTAAGTNDDAPPPYRMQLRALAHFMVAQGSQALQDAPERLKAMELAMQEAAQAKGDAATETREGLQLRTARWLLDEHQPKNALQQLEALPQGTGRRIQALRLKLQAARQLGHAALALETGRALVRHKAFSETAGKVLMTRLASDMVDSACDAGQLQTIWQKLDKTERQQTDVALRASQRLLALQGDAALARAWLLPAWEQFAADPAQLAPHQRSALFAALHGNAELVDAHWLQRIEQAHLHHPHQASLQYLMGMACMQRQLWGKAQHLLTQAAHGLHDEPALQRHAWRALATIAEDRQDHEAAAAAWKKAALVDTER